MTQPALISDSARTSRKRGFTLLEVVVATGVLAVAVVAMLTFQTAINRSVGNIADTDRAVCLADAIKMELGRIRDRAGRQSGGDGLSALANLVAPPPNAPGLRLVVPRDGSRVSDETEADDRVRGVPLRDRYYLIEVRPQPAPLTYVAGAGFLAVSCRVSWPYRLPTGTDPNASVAASPRQASRVMLNLAISP